MLRSPGPRPTTASRPRGRPARSSIGSRRPRNRAGGAFALGLGDNQFGIVAGGGERRGFGDTWRSGFALTISEGLAIRSIGRKFLSREESHLVAIAKPGDRWFVLFEVYRGKAGDGVGRQIVCLQGVRDEVRRLPLGRAAFAADADSERRTDERRDDAASLQLLAR